MPHVDQIVLVLLAIGLVASIVYPWRRGVRGRRLAVTGIAMFYGVTLVAMLGFHCVDVLYALTHRLPSMDGSPFAYDWRTYSLLLFGTLLVWLGIRALRAALRLARGDATARADILRIAAVVLAVVLPIIPLQAFFGYLISGMSALTIVAVAAGARSAPRAHPASTMRASESPATVEARSPRVGAEG